MKNQKKVLILKIVEFKETKSLTKKIVRKIRKTEIDYSKKKVRKEVLDEMRYKYLKSVRKYMKQ